MIYLYIDRFIIKHQSQNLKEMKQDFKERISPGQRVTVYSTKPLKRGIALKVDSDKGITISYLGLSKTETINWNDIDKITENGNIYVSTQGYKPGGGSWGASSDARLKSNVAPLTGSLDLIKSLAPVSYTWNYKNNEPTVGFIAQDVQKILPNAVTTIEPTEDQKPFITDDKLLALGFQNDMTAYLVGAIQELNTLVQTQAAQIAALQAKA